MWKYPLTFKRRKKETTVFSSWSCRNSQFLSLKSDWSPKFTSRHLTFYTFILSTCFLLKQVIHFYFLCEACSRRKSKKTGEEFVESQEWLVKTTANQCRLLENKLSPAAWKTFQRNAAMCAPKSSAPGGSISISHGDRRANRSLSVVFKSKFHLRVTVKSKLVSKFLGKSSV